MTVFHTPFCKVLLSCSSTRKRTRRSPAPNYIDTVADATAPPFVTVRFTHSTHHARRYVLL